MEKTPKIGGGEWRKSHAREFLRISAALGVSALLYAGTKIKNYIEKQNSNNE
jgi:hypothetical protein